jgi:L-asparaginase II
MSVRHSPHRKLEAMSYVHVLRGGLLESRHRVHAAVVRPDGSLKASVGDARFTTFLRSSAKPFQAQVLIPHLAALNLESRHLAVAMASHAGEDVHVETVRDLQARAGVDAAWLVCGTHAPFDKATREALRARGEKPSVLHNNCSGKHSGMLAACLAKGLPPRGYEQPNHPLQLEIQGVMRRLLGTDDLGVAVDGCGVPCFRAPLMNAALGMARLAQPTSLPELQLGLEVAFEAMREHSYLIAGRGRIDTVLMRCVPGLVSKIGAEAFIGMSLRDSSHGPLGIAVKIEDGNERARDIAVMRILEELGVVTPDHTDLQAFRVEIVKNHARLEVGSVEAAFDLAWT